MSDTFVPLVPAILGSREPSFASLNGRTVSQAAQKLASDASKPAASSPAPAGNSTCSKPKISLQRTGDIVSSIRIVCGCGEIVELTCVY